VKTLRSYLYVPGDRPDMVGKAAARGADALILDLEDSVVPEHKEMARRTVREALGSGTLSGVSVWARVNPTGPGRGRHWSGELSSDLEAVTHRGLSGIVVAKCESGQALSLGIAELRRLEAERGLAPVDVVALIESAAGLSNCEALARLDGVSRLQLGEADLVSSLGLDVSDSEEELLPARHRVVLASAAADLAPPAGSVSPEVYDIERLRTTTERLRRLGFLGRAVVHPAQIPVVHDVFTPSDAAVAQARDLVSAYAAAVNEGSGVLLDERGRMVDEAVIRSARRLIELRERS
jgi:citrate lyase subunit beta / citryl-CoA lyase